MTASSGSFESVFAPDMKVRLAGGHGWDFFFLCQVTKMSDMVQNSLIFLPNIKIMTAKQLEKICTGNFILIFFSEY